MNHETPSAEIFDNIKDAATQVWNTKDNTYGYVDEKLAIINRISNYADNVMICWRLFDHINQQEMTQYLTEESFRYIIANN